MELREEDTEEQYLVRNDLTKTEGKLTPSLQTRQSKTQVKQTENPQQKSKAKIHPTPQSPVM